MRNRRFVKGVGALAGLALLTAACGGDDSGSSDDGGGDGGGEAVEVSLAWVGPLTGDAANLGILIRDGAKVAIEQFNEEHEGEIVVTMEEFDTQGDPAQAPTVLGDYIDDDSIIGVVGPAFSGETNAVLPTLDEEGLVMVSASATNVDLPNAVPDGRVFHRVLPDDAAQAAGIAKYLTTELPDASVAIVHDNSDYGKGLAEDQLKPLLDEGGVEIVAEEVIDPDADDYSAAVNAVNSSNADVVFFGGYYEEAGQLRKQLVDAGSEATFISGDGSLDPGFVEAAGEEAAEGSLLTCPCSYATPESEGALGEFATAYEELNDSSPGTYSAEGFDATNILLAGIADGNQDRASLLDYVEGLTDVPEAISKEVVFAENGNIEAQGIFIFEIVDGAITQKLATDDL